MTMKKLLILSAFAILTIQASAQGDKLITVLGDTLTGKVYFQVGDKYTYDFATVRNKGGRERIVANRIQRVIMEKGKEYVAKKINSRYQMVEVVFEGSYLSIYNFVDVESNNKNDFGLTIITSLDGKEHIVSNIGFKGRLSGFLEDCPEVAEKVNSGELKKSDLVDIITQYNLCVDAQSQITINKTVDIKTHESIGDLIKRVAGTGLQNKADVIDMLHDVNNKIQNGKAVPEYLKSGIISALGDNQELIDSFNAIVK